MPDNKKLEIGKLEEYYDNLFLDQMDELKKPLEDAIKVIVKDYDIHDMSVVFSKLADYCEKASIATDNYDLAVDNIDKEEDLDKLQEMRNNTEEALNVVESRIEDIINFLKKEV